MKRLRNVLTILTIVSLLICSVGTFAQTNQVEAKLKEMMQQLKIPGLSVAVVKDGQIVYEKALGLKDIEKNIPLAEDDIFRIASISKSFCATAIMQLVERGKLSLDDDVSDLVGFKVRNPNFLEKKITLRMLLSHTSSLSDKGGYFNFDAIDPAKNNGETKCYGDYEPGTKFLYCNLNYTLIGAIIERASGERFDNYIAKHIIKPLGIYAGYNVDSLDRNKFATLYTYNKAKDTLTESKTAYIANRAIWNNYQMGYSAYSFSPTGGMKISASDLAKVMLMHMNYGIYKGKRILSEKSSKLMQSPSTDTGTGDYYGFAIRVRKSPKLAGNNWLVGHTGSASGLLSAMFYNPDKKFGFVLISTGSVRDTYDIPFEIRKVLVDGINILYENFIK
jgi:CubicO group peptidase (beta-lactamase class C family)